MPSPAPPLWARPASANGNRSEAQIACPSYPPKMQAKVPPQPPALPPADLCKRASPLLKMPASGKPTPRSWRPRAFTPSPGAGNSKCSRRSSGNIARASRRSSLPIPTAEYSVPCPEPGPSSPRACASEIGSERALYEDAQGFQCMAGTAPLSYQSGQVHKVNLRRTCH